MTAFAKNSGKFLYNALISGFLCLLFNYILLAFDSFPCLKTEPIFYTNANTANSKVMLVIFILGLCLWSALIFLLGKHMLLPTKFLLVDMISVILVQVIWFAFFNPTDSSGIAGHLTGWTYSVAELVNPNIPQLYESTMEYISSLEHILPVALLWGAIILHKKEDKKISANTNHIILRQPELLIAVKSVLFVMCILEIFRIFNTYHEYFKKNNISFDKIALLFLWIAILIYLVLSLCLKDRIRIKENSISIIHFPVFINKKINRRDVIKICPAQLDELTFFEKLKFHCYSNQFLFKIKSCKKEIYITCSNENEANKLHNYSESFKNDTKDDFTPLQ